jgi:hypothetical protein
MNAALALAIVVTTLTSISALAQQQDQTTPAGDSAKVTYAPTAGEFGDLAASHAYEMIPVVCELQGKLDSLTAKVGDRVVLKTRDKVLTSNGTVIPSGAHVVGQVTQVETYDPDRGPALIAIAFDRVEMKNGQSIAVYTLIRGLMQASMMNRGEMRNDGMGGMPVPLGQGVNGGRMSPDYGGMTPVAGSEAGQMDPVSDTNATERNKADTTPGSTDDTTLQPSGGSNSPTGAHAFAAARAVPHPTGIRGVMLAGNSTSSGVLLAPVHDLHFESGTQIQLGVAADR